MMKAFVNTDIYGPSQVYSEHALIVENGIIKAISLAADLPVGIEIVDLGGASIAPGFVDLQVNGGGGILFNSHFDEQSLQTALNAHQRTGATSIFPTIFTGSMDAMWGLLSSAKSLRKSGFGGIAGIHFEGPVINAAKAGVHDQKNILSLTDELVDLYQSAASAMPTLVTLAPEMVEPSKISALRNAGVMIFAGHTNATYEEMTFGLRSGIQGATHLYNAMSGLTSREPGVVGAILANNDSTASIILDGVHLHWASFITAYKAMKPKNLFLVTDAMPCVGSDISEFDLGDLHVFVQDGRCVTADGVLAGSALTMARAVKNAIQKAGVQRPEALRMASEYPAQFAGLEGIGALRPGSKADFVVFTGEIDVREVYVRGERLN
jgi:N-acetylglucosamine-6-phosphate deacetylase